MENIGKKVKQGDTWSPDLTGRGGNFLLNWSILQYLLSCPNWIINLLLYCDYSLGVWNEKSSPSPFRTDFQNEQLSTLFELEFEDVREMSKTYYEGGMPALDALAQLVMKKVSMDSIRLKDAIPIMDTVPYVFYLQSLTAMGMGILCLYILGFLAHFVL